MIEEKNDKIEYIIKTPKKSIIPRSEKQKEYVRALRQSDITISAGPAGTGKTFLAVAVGLTMLLEKKIERIILSRPAVEAGEQGRDNQHPERITAHGASEGAFDNRVFRQEARKSNRHARDRPKWDTDTGDRQRTDHHCPECIWDFLA